jgi:hypothetical protein
MMLYSNQELNTNHQSLRTRNSEVQNSEEFQEMESFGKSLL